MTDPAPASEIEKYVINIRRSASGPVAAIDGTFEDRRFAHLHLIASGRLEFADTIASLRARVAELEDGLRPFAGLASIMRDCPPEMGAMRPSFSYPVVASNRTVRVEHFIKADALLNAPVGEQPHD